MLLKDRVVRRGPVGGPRALALHTHGGRGGHHDRDGGHVVPFGGGDQRLPGSPGDVRGVDDRKPAPRHPALQDQVQGVDRVGSRLLVARVVAHRLAHRIQ